MTPSSAICNSLLSHQIHSTSLGINCSVPGATLSSLYGQQGRLSLCSSPAFQVPRLKQGQTSESRPTPCHGLHTDTQGMAVLHSRLWHRHSFFSPMSRKRGADAPRRQSAGTPTLCLSAAGHGLLLHTDPTS